jgi:hypothetical protein
MSYEQVKDFIASCSSKQLRQLQALISERLHTLQHRGYGVEGTGGRFIPIEETEIKLKEAK